MMWCKQYQVKIITLIIKAIGFNVETVNYKNLTF